MKRAKSPLLESNSKGEVLIGLQKDCIALRSPDITKTRVIREDPLSKGVIKSNNIFYLIQQKQAAKNLSNGSTGQAKDVRS